MGRFARTALAGGHDAAEAQSPPILVLNPKNVRTFTNMHNEEPQSNPSADG